MGAIKNKLRQVLCTFALSVGALTNANAVLTITITKQANNVVLSGIGSIDTTGMTAITGSTITIDRISSRAFYVGGYVTSNIYSNAFTSELETFFKPSTFWGTSYNRGGTVFFHLGPGTSSLLGLPSGYISGEPLDLETIIPNEGLDSLGLTPGTTFTYELTSGDRVVINVGSAQTISGVTSSPAALVFSTGGTFRVSATAGSSSSPLRYSSLTPSICSVADELINEFTVVGAGTCTAAVDQAHDSVYSPASQVTLPVIIDKATQTLTFPAQSSQNFIANGTFAVSPLATAEPVGPARLITYSSGDATICTVSGSEVTMISTGNCPLIASQVNDANYVDAQQVTQNVTIAPGISEMSVTSSPNPSLLGQEVTFTVAITPESIKSASLNRKAAVVPTGTISLTDNGQPLGSAVTLDATGAASFTTKAFAAPGAHSIVAAYSGDAFYAQSQSAAFTQTVSAAPVVEPEPVTPTPVPSMSAVGLVLLNLIGGLALFLRRRASQA